MQRSWSRPLAVTAGLLLAALAIQPATPPASAEPTPDFKPYAEAVPGTQAPLDMVPIPAGTFLMGSPATEPDRTPDEGPQHEVKVHAFWMSKAETLWDHFDQFYKNEGITEGSKQREEPVVTADAVTRPTPHYTDDTWGHGREGKPCLGITHHAAEMFCVWLSRKTGKTYRLPTEAEWEYACRAGSKTAYPWGDDADKLGDYEWYAKNAEDDTHEPAKKKANAWGLHDMLGNVAEWCFDHYSADDYKAGAGKTLVNPFRKPTTVRYSHVVRGGSFADDAAKCRSAARRGSDKSWLKRDPQRPQSIWWMTDCDWVGFRIVRPVTELPELKGYLPPVDWKSKDTDEK
ncbi:MAG: SUMF1/EgtB/PvdO family nonheme iron enzyme [Gemmataceae bacterium]